MSRTTEHPDDSAASQANVCTPGRGADPDQSPPLSPPTWTLAESRSAAFEETLRCSPVPGACPMCGASVQREPSLDGRATPGWWCQATHSLHFWQWRAQSLKRGLAARRYVLPPAPASGGIPHYPGVTFKDLDSAQEDMRSDRVRWAAQGYDPAG